MDLFLTLLAKNIIIHEHLLLLIVNNIKPYVQPMVFRDVMCQADNASLVLQVTNSSNFV